MSGAVPEVPMKEPVAGDLGERRMAQLGLHMARDRVALAAELLAEGLSMLREEEQAGAG